MKRVEKSEKRRDLVARFLFLFSVAPENEKKGRKKKEQNKRGVVIILIERGRFLCTYIYTSRDGLSSRGACECVCGITLLCCSIKRFEENKKLRWSSSSSFVLVRSM